MEVITVLVIFGLLAAILLPTIGSILRGAQASAVGSTLENIREAIANYQENVGAYPRRLFMLNTQPVVGDDDSCGNNLSGAERNRWRGPYLTTTLNGDFPVGDATVKDSLTRVPANNNTTEPGILQLSVTSVDSTTAYDVETQFDGGPNYSTGSILWTATGPRIGTLTFQIAIRGC
jgi:type II secretory pathway pseudopilin PulG